MRTAPFAALLLTATLACFAVTAACTDGQLVQASQEVSAAAEQKMVADGLDPANVSLDQAKAYLAQAYVEWLETHGQEVPEPAVPWWKQLIDIGVGYVTGASVLSLATTRGRGNWANVFAQTGPKASLESLAAIFLQKHTPPTAKVITDAAVAEAASSG